MPIHPTNRKGSRSPGRGSEPESGEREARRKGSGWVVALPAFVRRRLGITDPGPVYWHVARRAEAILTTTRERRSGGPDTTSLIRELEQANRLVARLRQRNESRERALYAEGYALGRQDEHEVLTKPGGKRANELRRRRLGHYAWSGRIPRGYVQVERVAAPVLEGENDPPPDPSSPPLVEQGAGASGRQPQAPHL